MKKSSAQLRQPDLFSEGLNDGAAEAAPLTVEQEAASLDNAASAPLKITTLGLPNELFADAARRAGRLNAASVSEEEYQALLRERQRLLDKKFDGTMSKSESNRLEYVRRSLDRIEDARHGAALDALEGSVGKFEQFLLQVEDLKSQLSQRAKGPRR